MVRHRKSSRVELSGDNQAISLGGLGAGTHRSEDNLAVGILFLQGIEYKAQYRGVTVVFADRFFPSSKTCHACGQIHDMPLGERQMACDCGHIMDRDFNAAKNLDRYGLDRLDALRPDVKRTQEPDKTGLPALALTA